VLLECIQLLPCCKILSIQEAVAPLRFGAEGRLRWLYPNIRVLFLNIRQNEFSSLLAYHVNRADREESRNARKHGRIRHP
jgi:hypothetical protein